MGGPEMARLAVACNFVGALVVAVAGYFGLAAGYGGPILWSDWRWCATWWGGWALLAIGFGLQWFALGAVSGGRPRPAAVVGAAATETLPSDSEALRTQLAELNTRARHYGSQVWQIPFAYVGIVGVVVSQVADKSTGTIRAALIGGFVFGILALVHLASMLDGNRRAVTHIRRVEQALTLRLTVEYRPIWYVGPLAGIVLVTAAACGIAAICLR